MVIQIQVHDGHEVKTRTYRNIFKGKNLAQFTEGFFAGHTQYRWGVMVQLKGKERILLHSYGKKDDRPRMYTCDDHRNWVQHCPGCYQANKDIQ